MGQCPNKFAKSLDPSGYEIYTSYYCLNNDKVFLIHAGWVKLLKYFMFKTSILPPSHGICKEQEAEAGEKAPESGLFRSPEPS